ncbi:phage baseplate assembly protein domain-containing protein [Pseudomonas arsenicoxydans]|uniref:phage baseplate assembly protein domain-containing protein n=1 Tax=Pseudomonas arsenicoxydans TaxID=702115 RepID=UPI001375AA61|nr:phage baseplate assembly protein [Pseudomonas arsenicoxydans]
MNFLAKLVKYVDAKRQAAVSYLGTPQDIGVLLPYGMHSSPPAGAVFVVLPMSGRASDAVGIPNASWLRKLELKPGEMYVGNDVAGTRILFKEAGGIEVLATADVVVHAPRGAVVNGDTTVNGNAVINGDTDITGTLKVAGVVVNGHVHANPEGGNVGPME